MIKGIKMTIKKANQYLREGKTKEALKEYQKIETSNPLYDQAQFNIALIEQNLDSIILKKGRQTTIGKVVSTSSNLLSSNSKPLVSVVMPVFNVAPYLDASIISVLNQTYKNIELIIVNDASTDNGLNIIKMFEQQDSRIRVIDLEFNTLGGAGIPSNIGVDNAKGEYVAYADSDDILDKYAVENMLQAALTNKADIVIADFCNFNDETRIIDIAYDKKYWKDLPVNTVFNPKEYSKVFRLSPVPWRKLYKRSFLENNNIRFPEGDYFYEDNPLHWFVLAEASKVILVDKVVAYHRMGREGQTMAAGAYKLSALLMHINTIRRKVEDNKNPNILNEFLSYLVDTSWIINRQKDSLLKSILAKRFYQELSRSDFTHLNSYKNSLNKIESFTNSYPSLDLTIIIYNDDNLDLENIIRRIRLLTDISYNIYIVNKKDQAIDEIESYNILGVDVLVFNIVSNSAQVRNALLPICVGKYTLFLSSNFQGMEKIPSLIKKMNDESLDLIYPKSFSRLESASSLIIRTHYMQDKNINFTSFLLYDLSFIGLAFYNTVKKEPSSILEELYSSKVGKVLKDNYEKDEFFKVFKKTFTHLEKESKEFLMRAQADIISVCERNIETDNWKYSFRDEYKNLVGFLEKGGCH